ncbi:MAG: sigma 54-interacting transcriptional regulator [Planctomycetes bacterium]|nr:sigma 54-interacting transcriptional regulator [Planctomycetota bacterium]
MKPTARPSTLAELRQSGWKPLPVKDEVRKNLLARLRSGQTLFPGIIGYDETVIPQVENALLSRHDLLFLGLRGQAKSRMIRALAGLLDEAIPAVQGCEIHDDPYRPLCRSCHERAAQEGDELPIVWVSRAERYGEKLATPDVTIADLIGETDLVKVAEGRYLSDERTMHFGLIPRCHRGIFAINELPDLAPKIQVGLFNILEERDFQIRGYSVRLPLDILMVFSANPEDYTNRGRIVTPLKDRIGSVIVTHYPRTRPEGVRIMEENAWWERDGDAPKVEIPPFLKDIVEEIARQARSSGEVSRSSGVSVRMSVANLENLVSSVERRAIKLGESSAVGRLGDLRHALASSRGKIELEVSLEGRSEEDVLQGLILKAVREVFQPHLDVTEFETEIEVLGALGLEVAEDMPAEKYVQMCRKVKELDRMVRHLMRKVGGLDGGPAHLAAAVEFLLEGLHASKKLNKNEVQGRSVYQS